MELLLTVEQAATRLQVDKETIRRRLRTGTLRGVKSGNKLWRVPESAIIADTNTGQPRANSTPQFLAKTILAGLDSADPTTRNNAIIALANADSKTSELVESEIQKSMAAYDGPEDDFSDWRALDGEPFRFPEEGAIR